MFPLGAVPVLSRASTVAVEIRARNLLLKLFMAAFAVDAAAAASCTRWL